jgi:plasmid stabilization system protein ParE
MRWWTREVRLRVDAERDLSDAAAWYEQQLPGLGHQFLDEVLAKLSAIADTPLLFPVVHRRVRRALISRFPFCVYFHIDGDLIVVLAVMHASRDPRRWKTRA